MFVDNKKIKIPQFSIFLRWFSRNFVEISRACRVLGFCPGFINFLHYLWRHGFDTVYEKWVFISCTCFLFYRKFKVETFT